MRIWCPVWKKFGSWINSPDPQHCFQCNKSSKKVSLKVWQNLSWLVLNIRCTCMVHMPSYIWKLYFEQLQSQHYESSDCPPPHYRQPSPLCMAAWPSSIWKRTPVWLITIPMLKTKGKTCMVKEPYCVKQLSRNQLCKIGLKRNVSDSKTLKFYRCLP